MKGILLPAYVDAINTRKDRSVKISLVTQELSPDQAGQIFNLLNHLIIAYLSEKDIDSKEADMVDKIDAELSGKTQSQRIRNVLYKLYEQDNEGYKDFKNYYYDKTERYIEHLKQRIK
jgi:hypothetical protein